MSCLSAAAVPQGAPSAPSFVASARVRGAPRAQRPPPPRALSDPRGYTFEEWVTPQILEVEEPAALEMAQRMKRVDVTVEGLPRPVPTACVGPEDPSVAGRGSPVVLLHGFDSSSLEFRRFHPLLSAELDAWAVDLIGWGFTDNLHSAEADPGVAITPAVKRAHLRAFQQQVLGGRRMTLLGASLGGAVAIDFAYHHPDLVDKVVLVDAQGFIDGIGPMSGARRARPPRPPPRRASLRARGARPPPRPASPHPRLPASPPLPQPCPTGWPGRASRCCGRGASATWPTR